MLSLGERVPAFSLPDQSGLTKTFTDLCGARGLILYVYPKDNTPGCTREAEAFREALSAIKTKGYALVGLSKDSVSSHLGFCTKYALPFPLLSDPDLGLLKALGAWGTKKLYGKESEGVIRSTFVFDAAGVLLSVYPKVKVDGHIEQVQRDLA